MVDPENHRPDLASFIPFIEDDREYLMGQSCRNEDSVKGVSAEIVNRSSDAVSKDIILADGRMMVGFYGQTVKSLD